MKIKKNNFKTTLHFSILTLLFFTHIITLCLSSDTISANFTLSGNQTIISSGGNFELGFFTPGNSAKHYIGIWYKKVNLQTIVWVANRETPILDKNLAQLKISDNNLVLLNESKIKIWSTDVTINPNSNNSVIAVLLDNGNLVLRDSSNFTFWESFNFPTDTWLPGGKISYDNRTKTKQLLISWKNSEDPSPGLFSLELDPVEKQYIIRWNRTRQYWTSGPWNDRIFSQVPEMTLNYIYNFSYVDNVNESYFTYSMYDSSTISRFVMNVSGQIKQSSWYDRTNWNLFWSQPRQQCTVYSYCGAFGICNVKSLPFCNCLPGFVQKSRIDWNLVDYSGGCVREVNLQCESGNRNTREKDRFFMNSFMSLPVNATTFASSEKECEFSCLGNCSCTAYSYDGNVCSRWDGELLNMQQLADGDSSGKTIYIKLSASSSVFSGKKNKGVLIGAIIGSVGGLLILLAIVFAVIWRRNRRTVRSLKSSDGSLVAFGYKDLVFATKNFSEKLGGGGFGSVFKGTLPPDSSAIAVKRLESVSQGEKQFRTEVSTIGTIQHVNLVRLRGFCSEGSTKRLLVYDYMENKSLDSHLFYDSKNSNVLDWITRYKIALGIARGLVYLHEKCRDCIIHCDIKPENILLDGEFCPKVADFGLAKLVGRDFSRVLTTMRGTRGYLAPEWISGVAITAKADVYSYGMMLFELISGRRNSENFGENKEFKFFPSFAASLLVEGGDILGLLDKRLEGKGDVEEVSRILKIACWCIQEDESVRPSMSQVVQILEGVVDVSLPPIPRSIQVLDENEEDIVFFTDSSSGPSSQSKGTSSSTN